MIGAAQINLSEWGSVGPATEPSLRHRWLEDKDQIELARRLTSARILDVIELRDGMALRARSFVGRLRLGNLEITVQPKIKGIKLLHLLRYAYGLRDLRLLDDAQYGLESVAFQDLLVHQLAVEARELFSRGLHRKYLRRDDELVTPRGRVDVHRLATRDPASFSGLPCTHHPRVEDCLENQVLLVGVLLAMDLTANRIVRSRLRLLATQLGETVSRVTLCREIFARLGRERSRLTAAYEPALQIVKLLFEGHGVSIASKSRDVGLSGFMFDMNRFFQALMSRLLREGTDDDALSVRDEHTLRGMMQYDADQNPRNRRAPQPRPDFVVLKARAVVGVLDAKYRDLWDNSLPREMLYQLGIYAMSQEQCDEAAILYPTTSAAARPASISIRSPLTGSRRARVVLRPVDLNRVAAIVASPPGQGSTRNKRELANYLAFGTARAAPITATP